jgi:hypothetical protein
LGGLKFKASPISKITKAKQTTVQAVEWLLCKSEDLSSNPRLTKKGEFQPSMEVHTCNSSTEEAEAGDFELEASLTT